MSTVTARIESAQRMGALLVDQLTAPVRFTQAASRADARRRAGRSSRSGPGNVLSGLVKRIDRSVKAISVNNLASLEKLKETPRHCVTASARSRARRRSSPARRAGSAARSRSSSRAPAPQVVVGYRTGAEEAEALAQEIGGRAVQADVSDPEEAARLVEEAGDLDILVNNAGLTRDGLLARMSDDDWRDGDRDEPRRRSSTPAAPSPAG